MPGEIITARNCYILIILVSFLFPLAIQVILIRFFGLYREKAIRQKGPVAAALFGLLPLGGLFLAWLFVFFIRNTAAIFWSGFYLFAVYLLMAYVYFHVFNMSETARRIRILTYGHRQGKVVKQKLIQDYTRNKMVEIRVARLLALRELQQRDFSYLIGRGILLIPARGVFAFRRLLFPKRIK